MPIMPSGVVSQADMGRRVRAIERKLARDVVRIRHAVTLNSTGDGAVFFRIVLSDEASRENRLQEVTERVEAELLKAIPFDEFGLYQYFNYRSVSEQAMLKEPAWS